MFCLASRVGLPLSHHESAFQRPPFTRALDPSISTGFHTTPERLALADARTILFENVEPNQRPRLAAAYVKAIDAGGRRNPVGRSCEECLVCIDDIVHLLFALSEGDLELAHRSHFGGECRA